QLLEIGMEQLRFTRDEIRDYLAASGWPLLEDGSLDWLATRTDGWITGIKLAGLALRNPGAADSLLRTYSGSHRAVSDFFAEQVLSVPSPEARNFLPEYAVPGGAEFPAQERGARPLLRRALRPRAGDPPVPAIAGGSGGGGAVSGRPRRRAPVVPLPSAVSGFFAAAPGGGRVRGAGRPAP